MPIYEYRCEECGRAFERLRRISEADEPIECPACRSDRVKRQLSSFATGGCGASAGGGRSRFR